MNETTAYGAVAAPRQWAPSPTSQHDIERVEQAVGRGIPYARRVFPAVVAFLSAVVAWTFLDGTPGRGVALAVVTVGTLTLIGIWIYRIGRTMPLVAVLASQDLLWYGLPLAAGNESLDPYGEDDMIGVAVSFAIYFAAVAAGYTVTVFRRRPAPAAPLVIDVLTGGGRRKMTVVALLGLGACAIIEAGLLFGWLWPILARLPQGSMNIIRTCLSAGICGATLFLAHEVGRKHLKGAAFWAFALFWSMIFFTRVASILLSSTMAMAGALVFGLYLGGGRVPWKSIATLLAIISFLNLSKAEMRERYWGEDSRTLIASGLPEYFAEWSGRSLTLLGGGRGDGGPGRGETTSELEGQSLLDRIGNVQMMLYVRERLDRGGYEPVLGETYWVSLQALVPRVFWKDKPRSHIGQEILNVHFGRQTREQTYQTYIAWGLVPESIGNFGALLGPLGIGAFLGLCGGWIESKTAPLPLFSPGGVLAGFLVLSLVTSQGMVMSVFLSSLAQMAFVLVAAMFPFVRRLRWDGSGAVV